MKADNLWKTLYIVNIFEKLSLKRIYIYILKFLKRVYLDVYQRKCELEIRCVFTMEVIIYNRLVLVR